MNHYLSAYNKVTDELEFQLEIPSVHLPELILLMDWQTEEDQIYVYNLDHNQLQIIARMLGKAFTYDDYAFQLDCFT